MKTSLVVEPLLKTYIHYGYDFILHYCSLQSHLDNTMHFMSTNLFNVILPSYYDCDKCPMLKSSMPFKCDMALQNMLLSKHPFKMQPQIEINTSLEVLNNLRVMHYSYKN